jgi:hypothetical protein
MPHGVADNEWQSRYDCRQDKGDAARARRLVSPMPALSDYQKLLLALFALCSFAYFAVLNEPDNPNTLSRIALTVSIIEDGSFYIDDMAALTIDKSEVGEHIASDKAPGVSFMAVPSVYIASRIILLVDPQSTWIKPADNDDHDPNRRTYGLELLIWIATMFTSGLFTAVAVVALFDVARRLGASAHGALFAALAYGFATPAWGWATTFFGHACAGALLVIGLWFIVFITSRPPAPRGRVTFALAVAGGFALGAAIAAEFPTAIAAVMVGLFGLWRLRAWPRPPAGLVVLGALVGGVTAGLPLMAYNAMLFGSPFELGYAHVIGFEGMQTGFFGIGLPQPAVIWEVLFGGARGLIWISPVVFLAPLAWRHLARHGDRSLMVLSIAVFLSFLTINAGYHYWWGGASTGPRHLTAALPFLVLPLAWLWSGSGIAMRWVMIGLGAISVGLSFIVVATDSAGPELLRSNQLFEYILPRLLLSEYPLPVFFNHLPLPRLVQVGLYGLLCLGLFAFVLRAFQRWAEPQTMAPLLPAGFALNRASLKAFWPDLDGRDPGWLSAFAGDNRRAAIVSILGAAFVLRALVVVYLPSVHFPDEVYQTVEQAHRLLFDNGLVPWEFRDGIRSPVFIWLIAAVMWPAERLFGGPEGYQIAIGISLVTISLVPVYAAFRMGEKLGFTVALVASIATAVWFELIYFAGRPLTESVAAGALVGALYLLSADDHKLTARRLVAAGLLLGACTVFRFHLAPGLLVAGLWVGRLQFRDRWLPLLLGGLIPVLFAGWADWAYWGAPFHSFIENVRINIFENKASIFGVSAWHWYFEQFAVHWTGVIGGMILLIAVGARRAPMWVAVALVIIAFHSIIPHKEYRFILPAIACLIVVAGIGAGELVSTLLARQKAATSQGLTLFAACGLWLIMSISLATSWAYDQYWFQWRNWILASYEASYEEDLCGVMFFDRHWSGTGGWSRLHRDVPIYYLRSEEELHHHRSAYNVILGRQDSAERITAPFEQQACFWAPYAEEVCVFTRPGGCVADPDIEVNAVLVETGE